MTVATIDDDVIWLFLSILDGATNLTNKTSDDETTADACPEWLFTLPELFKAACSSKKSFAKVDFKSFCQLVDNSPVNQFLNDAGWQINLKEENTTSGQKTFCLKRL